MKITCDLGTKISLSAGVNPFHGLIAKPPVWIGGRAQVSFFPEAEGDPEIELESESAEALRDAMRQAAEILDDLINLHKEEAADKVAHSIKCSICGTWADTRRPKEWGHGDGKGSRCLGDGTMIFLATPVLIFLHNGDQPCWNKVVFSAITVGDHFREDDMEKDCPEYIALADAAPHFDGFRASMGVLVKRG